MRKRDHKTIYTDFKDDLKALGALYEKATFGLNAQKVEPAFHSSLAEIVFHRGYVAFEVFLSTLFVAYINQDSAAFQADYEQQAKASVSNKFGPWWGDRFHLTPEKHVNVTDVEMLIDPKGFNLTFSSTKELLETAESWLSAKHQTGFTSLTHDDKVFMDAARAVRNCVAHQSNSSFGRMNDVLANLSPAGIYAGLKRGGKKVEDPGAYLKADSNGRPRAIVYVEFLDRIAKMLKSV